MPINQTTFLIELFKTKETKGAIRYEEKVDTADDGTVNTIYIRKAALRRAGSEPPTKITVTLEL